MAPSSRKLSVALVFTFFACSTFVACGGASVAPTDLGGPSALLGGPGISGLSWSPTGSMAQARSSATATRLADGTVVVAGGVGPILNKDYDYVDELETTERYDPHTGTWSASGSLTIPRSTHGAALLQDGRVLVVGGYSDFAPQATAEIYNPATNTWSLAAWMSNARTYSLVTVLSDGRVLAAGGANGRTVATAEVYDPQRNVWSPVGSMTSARCYAAVALLPNGKVLVAGGYDGSASLSSAEIFDPSSGTWSATLSMSVARRFFHAAVLPNGRVLVVGGSDEFPGAEIFDPASGTWSPTADMAQPSRYYSETISLADGRVLVAGGLNLNAYLDGAEMFDAATGLWSPINSMTMPRAVAASAELLDGRVLIAGGDGITPAGVSFITNTAETYLLYPSNLPPVAVCRSVVVATSPTTCEASVDVNNGSSDPDTGPGPLMLSQAPAGPYALGDTTVSLVADDGAAQSTCSAVVTVVDNTPPQITCPDDDPSVPGNQVYLECVNGGAVGTFTAQVTDNCGGGTATCAASGALLPLGSTTSVTCSARDGSQNQASCNLQAIVRDTRPPVPGGSRGMVLWPADSTLKEVSLMDCAGHLVDACSGRLIPLKDHAAITRITSDEEEDAPGNSDGNTVGDMQIKKPWLALLRAERTTLRDGRVYTVHYQAKDPAGNVVNSSCKVTVPRFSDTPAVEGPPLYCVGQDCP